ncbi:polysaccharide deacetylase family protein [Bacillus sp. B-jedd]|uniref:polysaccharide deacetylase family protein n=1 Tax=Bacillus sp. B-jedd TaxID=1476857 RepID=UPI0005156622|nr:polysaccharide deacetylase family protein [Bacillus sp. B-jedd]CEG26842.1 polysaccharide deacetylase [Bacillus sp. B-jedd]
MRRTGFFLFASLLAISIVANPYVSSYLDTLKTGARPAIKQANPLYEKIAASAAEVRIPASDARIDKVWKAIPGYNGLEVDIPASYKKMKAAGKYKKEKLVFKEIKPKVHLRDLPPAPVYRGNPEKPMVAFIINVAWGNEYLPDMLATLKKHNVYASFFLEGNWVKKNPELAKMISDAGHEIGNHSYSHPHMGKIPPDKAIEEMKKTNEVIKATTGITCKWFAPPSGTLAVNTPELAASLGMGTVMWTADTIDWQKPSPEVILSRIIPKAENGTIILMHPTDPTAKALERMIAAIKEKELKIGTVSELISEKRSGVFE